jgi:hypothetical protein
MNSIACPKTNIELPLAVSDLGDPDPAGGAIHRLTNPKPVQECPLPLTMALFNLNIL